MPTRTCPEGHRLEKTSDCPTCPQCEAAKKPSSGFLAKLAAPAFRALKNANVTTLKKLAALTEQDVLALHGMGKGSLPTLRAELAAAGLTFKVKAPPKKMKNLEARRRTSTSQR